MIVDLTKAFPCVENLEDTVLSEGMDLRDWFAGQALPAVMKTNGFASEEFDFIAITCYSIADAMMKARG